MMGDHDKVLEDAARVRVAKPTYAVRVPAVFAAELFTSIHSVSKELRCRDGAVFYLLLDGKCCRVTLEAL